MARNLLGRYTWLIDTLRRCGHLTFGEINARWRISIFSDGKSMPRRTFYNYRMAVGELFGVEICFNATDKTYYVESGDYHATSVTNWMLNSASISGILNDAREVSDRIFLEEVPSARDNLAPILDALKHNHSVKFTYHPFSRTFATQGVHVQPFLMKLFKQRWYMAGLNVEEERIKTYALDRMSSLEVQTDTFEIPADFDPEQYFHNSFGIVVDNSEPREVAIKVGIRQAKYLRALPLHHSQVETIHDDFSIFYYTLQLTQDFVAELMSHGSAIEVIAPTELRAMMAATLRDTLKLYDKKH
jgi:hypothetical protein